VSRTIFVAFVIWILKLKKRAIQVLSPLNISGYILNEMWSFWSRISTSVIGV